MTPQDWIAFSVHMARCHLGYARAARLRGDLWTARHFQRMAAGYREDALRDWFELQEVMEG